jgi:hypothetical protein
MKRKKKKVRRAAKARRSYVSNPRPAKVSRRRKYRRNPSAPIMDFILQLFAGVAGAVAIPKAANLAPLPAGIGSYVGLAAGLAAAYFGRKNPLILAAGMGGAIVSGRTLLLNAVPMLAGDTEFTEDEALAIANSDYELSGPLEGSPFAGPLEGSPFAGPLMGSPFAGPVM